MYLWCINNMPEDRVPEAAKELHPLLSRLL